MRNWEKLWWILAALFFLLQLINLAKQGANRETLVAVSELLLAIFLAIVWKLREQIFNLVKPLPNRFTRFLVLGYLATIVGETAYIFSKPLHQNLLIDLILVAPWYILWMATWYWVLKKYRFSLREAFFLGGFHGFVIEGVLTGFILASPILAIVAIPLLSTIYGCFFIVPYLVLQKEFESTNRQEVSRRKKIGLSLIPLLAYIPGFIWILILTNAWKLTLH